MADPLDLGGRSDAPFGVSSDADDVLIRRVRAEPQDAKKEVLVRIDGNDVNLPLAVRRTDPKGGELVGPDGEPLYRRTTVFDAAAKLWSGRELRTRIPTLCHMAHLKPAAVCRVCSVHVAAYKRGKFTPERKLLPACHLEVGGYEEPADSNPWMVITTRCGGGDKAERVQRNVRLVVEMLKADHLRPPRSADVKNPRFENELDLVAQLLEVTNTRERLRRRDKMFGRNFVARELTENTPSETDPRRPHTRPFRRIPLDLLPTPVEDEARALGPDVRRAWKEWNAEVDEKFPYSSPAVVVDHDACIQCDRCVRSCGDVRGYNVIGHTGKGYVARISFDLDLLMGPRERPARTAGSHPRPSSCVQCGECMAACPTGALSVRRRVQPRVWGKESPELIPLNPNVPIPGGAEFPDAMAIRAIRVKYRDPTGTVAEIAPFESVPFAYLKWNEGAVRKIVVPPGESRLLAGAGEYGSTAFLLTGTGQFDLYRAPPTRPGWIGRHLGRPTLLPTEPPLVSASGTDLILGEMAPLSYQTRSATIVVRGWEMERGEGKEVVVNKQVIVYELTRNLLDTLLRSPADQQRIRALYEWRGIQQGIREAKFLKQLPGIDSNQIAKDLIETGLVTFLRLTPRPGGVGADAYQDRKPEAELLLEGDHGHDFYIVRAGWVRVTVRTAEGRTRLLGLRGAGECLGEIALLASGPSAHLAGTDGLPPAPIGAVLDAVAMRRTEPGRNTATVTAIEPTELIRVPADVFWRRLCRHPAILRRLVDIALERLEEDDPLANVPRRVPIAVLGEFVGQSLHQAQNLLVIDLLSCTRCDDCTRACADAHPDGRNRMLRDGLRYGDFLVVTSCRSCHTPYCMNDCPVDAIHRRGDQLQVVIEDHCIGCGLCEKNCPFGSINMVPRTGAAPVRATQDGNPSLIARPRKAVNCDLCGGGEPKCVYACPNDSALRLSGDALSAFFQNPPIAGG